MRSDAERAGFAGWAEAMRRCRICVERPRIAPLPHAPRPIFDYRPGLPYGAHSPNNNLRRRIEKNLYLRATGDFWQR